MTTLEITLRVKVGETWPVVAEFDGDEGMLSERSEGLLALDTQQLEQLVHEPREYGNALGQTLFSAAIREAFVKGLARSSGEPLRLLLFVEDLELRAIRWERLCAPVDQGWVQLASYQRVLFSRYLPSLTDRRFPPIGRGDLRALIVVASPPGLADYGLTHFDEAASVQGVITALGEVPHTLLASSVVGASGPPTLNQICERITSEGPTLLHIVAHGRALDDENLIYLSHDTDPNEVDSVTTSRLKERLANLNSEHGLPHLIFLSTCQSADPRADGALGGLGQRLVTELGVPAVVAMADLVTVETANALAEVFYRLLIKSREVDKALLGATAGLAERGDITVPVLYSRLGDRPLFDETVKRALTSNEIERGLKKLAPLLDQRAPVLKEDFAAAASTLRRSTGIAEGALSAEAREDRRQALATIDTICNEAIELSFMALATGAELPHYEGATCPFPGLTAFNETQRLFFHGRRALSDDLLAALKRQPCLSITGPSGSGKTSLVLAGLVPLLRDETPDLGLALLTPGELPLAALDQAIALQEQVGTTHMVVVVDQLEELFTICTADEERQRFAERLVQLADAHMLVLVLREDYFDECESLPALYDLINANRRQIESMRPEELREAIERQATSVGLRFEAGLTSTILNDVRDQPGLMPLTQHALRELWERRRGRWLRTSEYEAIGGVQRALAHSADEIYSQSSRENQERLRSIFVRLIKLDREGSGAGRRDARQRVAFEDLVPAGDNLATLRGLVDTLCESRLLVSSSGRAGNDTVEVAHEALIRAWPQLDTWLSEDRETLLQLAELRQQAQRWKERERDQSFLLRDTLLDDAAALTRQRRYPLNSLERTFIDDSEQAQEQRRQREIEQLKALADAQTRAAEEAQAREADAKRAATRFRFLATLAAGVAAVALVAMVVAAVLAGVAANESLLAERSANQARTAEGVANNERVTAEAARDDAQAQRATAVSAQQQADANARVANLRALISDAQAALGRGDAEQSVALSLLAVEQGEPSARAYFTLAEAAEYTSRKRFDFNDQVGAVAFSPDGLAMLAADESGMLVVWDRATGGELRRFQVEGVDDEVSINGASFTPDGQAIIISTKEGVLAEVTAVGSIPFSADRPGSIFRMAFSPDGSQLVTGGIDGFLSVWDLASRRELRRLPIVPNTYITGVGFDIDGTLFVAAVDGIVRVVNPEDGTIVREIPLVVETTDVSGNPTTNTCLPTVMLILPSENSPLLTGCYDGTIRLWNGLDGSLWQSLSGHSEQIASMALGVNGGDFVLVSSSLDQSVFLWNLSKGLKIGEFQGHSGEALSVAFSADGLNVLTGSFDQSVRLWDTLGGQQQSAYTPSENEPAEADSMVYIRLVSAGSELLGLDDAGDLARWELKNDTLTTEQQLEQPVIALSPDGSLTLLELPDGTLEVRDLAANKTISQVPGDLEADNLVAGFSYDNTSLLIAIGGSVPKLYQVADGSFVRDFVFSDYMEDAYINALAFSHDGTRVLGGTDALPDSLIVVWNVADGAEVGLLEAANSDLVSAVAFSPNGNKAFSTSWDRKVRLWDLATFAEERSFIGHTRKIYNLAVSADGKLVLSGGEDATMRLWDVASGQELARFEGHTAPVVDMLFAPDGTSAFSVASDGEVILWRTQTNDELTTWVRDNRAVPDLNCATQAIYGLCSQVTPTPGAAP